ncbi:MAG: trigger factor [Desulfuromonadaceae bacterium]|nr:trigger factor [Desulfuromonadaceae bacterium]
MQVHVEDVSPVQKKIHIEIPAERVNEEIEKAYSAIQKKAKLQGFRPGKAPMPIIKRTYSDAMRDEVMRKFYEQTLYKAIDDHKIDPVNSPTIECDILEQNVPFKYSALVEVMPQILLKDYSGLSVKKEIYVEKPQNIEDELKRMRENMAQLVPVAEGSFIKNGHSVTVDYSFSVEGFPEESNVSEESIVEIGSNRLIPGFDEQLIGMRTGETKEFSLTLPDGYRNQEASGKQGMFNVTIKDIKLKELPELDDEFAQQFGEYDTMDELRAKMVEYHGKHEADRIENDFKERVIQALIEKNPLEVPESLVKRQLDFMFENLKNRLKSQQMSIEMMGLDAAGFNARFHDDAADKVRGGLLLMELVEKEKIAVSEEDLSARYEKIAAGNPDMLKRIREYYSSNPKAKDSITAEIREDKAISFLIDSAVVTEVDAAELRAVRGE